MIKMLETMLSRANGGKKFIIRQLTSRCKAMPALKSVKTELFYWDGHKTVPIYENTIRGKEEDNLMREGLTVLGTALLTGEINVE